MRRTSATAIALVCIPWLATVARAADIHVDVDASVHGSPSFGFPPLEVFVPAGSYTCTLVQGTYGGWSHAFGNAGTWHTEVEVRHEDGTLVDELGNMLWADSAVEAWGMTTVSSLEFDLPADELLRFNVSDNIVWDNVGGVSVVLSESSPVSVRGATWTSVKALYR
ncbi:MAG TPA: hypothetical protein VKU85_18535 [bacterium]|nr:hypothetical protein [bacterium]